MKDGHSFIGYVRRVSGSSILVVIPDNIPLGDRRVGDKNYRVGRVGSFIKIPAGNTVLYGILSKISAPQTFESDQRESGAQSHRSFDVQLIGESTDGSNLRRGISMLPVIDDEVYIATEEDLAIIYGASASTAVPYGSHVSTQAVPLYLDLDKLVARHGIIVGSTGSGKSNATALLLKTFASGSFPNAQVVVIDPHGEYSAVLQDQAQVFSIHDKINPLYIPYWALSFDELAWFLVDRSSATETQQDKILRDKIYDEKLKKCSQLRAGGIAHTDLTPDSPVPFDIKKIWYDLYYEEYATFLERDNRKKIAYKYSMTGEPLKGSAEAVVPPSFEPPSSGDSPPYPPSVKLGLGVYLNKIFLRLKDRSFDFLLNPGSYDGVQKDLHDLLESWLGHSKPVTVINLEGIPFQVVDLVVGVITKILFQSMFWGRGLSGIGKDRPLLMVFEEGHAYLAQEKSLSFMTGYARTAVRRIFKEGRKYGIGGIVVTQRPSELDSAILSESGTYIVLRLSNEQDQRMIKTALPDELEGLTDLLPGLRTGEAIVAGESVQIPSRIRLPLVEPRPNSGDSEATKYWKKSRSSTPDYASTINSWRLNRMVRSAPDQGA